MTHPPQPLALRACPRPDFCDTIVVGLPPGADADPAAWVERIFDGLAAPLWVRALFRVRNALAGLMGIAPGRPDLFAVDRVEGLEALVVARESHLDFFVSVAVDSPGRRLLATTAVVLHGWRGRLYWLPTSLLHGPVFTGMITRAIRATG